jgi:hypothetical protein
LIRVSTSFRQQKKNARKKRNFELSVMQRQRMGEKRKVLWKDLGHFREKAPERFAPFLLSQAKLCSFNGKIFLAEV